MKKIIFFLSAIAILATSCGEKDAFTITGKLPSGEYDGQQVYLKTLGENWNGRELISIDTVAVANGQFVFKGLAKEGPMLHFIVLDDAPENMKRPVAVIVEPGQIEVTMDSISSVKGTSVNNSLQAYNTKMKAASEEMRNLYKQFSDTTITAEKKAELEKEAQASYEKRTAETFNFVKDNIKNQLGTYYFLMNSYAFDVDQQKELLAGLDEKYKTDERIQKIEAKVKAMEATSVGQTFTDIKAKTPEGKDAALSDYAGKGKYVLVDFWASWCGPCRAEMPKVVELYKQYKDKGFEIVGISLDRTNDDWVKGIKELGITWPQISDLKFWDSEGAALYGVSSIPHMLLIDKDGKIIERGITPDQLAEKLAELLK